MVEGATFRSWTESKAYGTWAPGHLIVNWAALSLGVPVFLFKLDPYGSYMDFDAQFRWIFASLSFWVLNLERSSSSGLRPHIVSRKLFLQWDWIN